MKNYEDKIKNLLSKMTLAEKVGQLQQCGPSLVGAFEVSFSELLDMMFDGKISQEEFGRLMSTAEPDYHIEDLKAGRIGSYNGIKGAETTNKLQKIAVEETRLGIPLLLGADVIHGYRTVFPIPLAESCAWDPELWQKTARVAAKEATAAGIHMTFAPMVDVAKDARWGRVSEGAGEDAYLSGLYGEAKVKGFQGDDLTAPDSLFACVKHFAGYGAVEGGRDYNRVDMSPQRFQEEYLPSYKPAVEAGARAVMPAFNDISGLPCSVNEWLLKDVLRGQWGFNGMTISDANAIAECVNHGIAEDKADAAAQAIHAGMDMDMTSNSYIENLDRLVKEGKVSMEDLDRACGDVLRLKFEHGLFENPYITSPKREADAYLLPEYRALAREMAGKSIVLLKNDKYVLPLSKNAKIAVSGLTADMPLEMTGAWALDGRAEDCVSLVDGLKNAGVDFEFLGAAPSDEIQLEAMAQQAQKADVILLTMGEMKDQSGEASSRADISIDRSQMALFYAMKATGRPVVVLLVNGRPLAIPELAEKADAILETWQLGVEAGNAMCDVLFGTLNPSAKLTTTFPYASGQCPVYYSHINTGRPGGKAKFTSKYLDTPLEPVYPFGYGKSYTTFSYSDLEVDADRKKKCLAVSVTVSNTGKIDGDEIVQCYFRDLVAKERVRPVKQLAAFKKIAIGAGKSKRVAFEIPFSKLGYYDRSMHYILEDGAFDIFAGSNSAEGLSQRIVIEF